MSERFRSRCLGLPLALLLWGIALQAQGVRQATGTVTGVVTDSANHGGLADVQVTVVPEGMTEAAVGLRGARTGPDGRFTITGVRAGNFVVHARLIGYKPAERRVEVLDGQSATANFALVQQTA